MAENMIELSGTPTSECLTALDRCTVLESDLFLISQQILSSVSPSRKWQLRDQTLSNEHRSLNAQYGLLSSQFSSEFEKICKFGSMAYESSADYSLAEHVHQYSIVEVSSALTQDTEQSLLVLATFTIDGKKSSICSLPTATYSLPKPVIGQLKFIASTHLNAIDESAEDFDGWCYPDGRAISREDFPEAFSEFGTAYGNGDGATTFNIPCLSNLFKPVVLTTNPSMSEDLTKIIPVNEVVKDHDHFLETIPVTGSVQCDLQFMNVDNTQVGNACHGAGGGSGTSQTYTVEFEFTGLTFMEDSLSSVNQSHADLAETHPTYNWIPTLIYIGNMKKL